jgi:hypothetical protein
MVLNKDDMLTLRHMGHGFNSAEFDNFVAAVRRRLLNLEASGIAVTKNHIIAAGTAELAQ